MKYIFIIILFIIEITPGFSQHKEVIITFADGTEMYHLYKTTDTIFIVQYPNKKKEAECVLRNGELDGLYTRWYENGNKMWTKEMKQGIANGKSSFYNNKGELVLTLLYRHGMVTDTIVSKSGSCVLLGNIWYSSTVYGGAENADGSSNISSTEGPFKNFEMNLVKLDSIRKPQLIGKFKSDYQGNFMVIVSNAANYGVYPKYTNIEELSPPYHSIPSQMSRSGNENWDVKLPFEFKKNEVLKIVSLKHYSVGYAP